MNKLKVKISSIEISDEQMNEFREAFDNLKLKSGKFSCIELGDALQAIGLNHTEAELYEMINEVDQTSEGEIKFQQFCLLMMKRLEELSSDEYLKQAFSIFDRDSDGFITTAEIKAILFDLGEYITEEEFAVMMQEIDFDNDGKISYADFVQAMRN